MESHCLMGTKFRSEKMKKLSRWMVAMAARQCECNLIPLHTLNDLNGKLYVRYIFKKKKKICLIKEITTICYDPVLS